MVLFDRKKVTDKPMNEKDIASNEKHPLYEIITDSASNLTKDLLQAFRIHMISYISTMNGREFLCYSPRRDDAVTGRHFYDALRKGANIETSLISPSRFTELFEPFLRKGRDILFTGMSGGLTGTVQSARLAAEDLMEQYPNRRIICVDSLSASLGEGLLVLQLSRLRDEGCTLEEAVSWIENNKMRMNQYFTVDNLKHLKKGGRISSAEAVIGNLLSIKPVLKGNEEGRIVLHNKVHSRRRALDYLFNIAKDRIAEPSSTIIGIAHCDAPEESEALAERFRQDLGVQDIIVRYYDLCTGSHVGPGTIAIFFLGKNRMEA